MAQARDPRTGRFISNRQPIQQTRQQRRQQDRRPSQPYRDALGRFAKRPPEPPPRQPRGRQEGQRDRRERRGGSRREQQWRDWSLNGFPNRELDEVYDINRRMNKPRNSSFGFRFRYHRYVLGEDDDTALALAENDT